jgi:uncharacterized membrane protein
MPPMFDKVFGLPLHTLVVHAAVVFVPLLALVAIGYAVAPRLRSRLDWAAGLLAVAAPLVAWLAVLSGNAFRRRLVAKGFGGQVLDRINRHMTYGNYTLWVVAVLGALTLLLLAGTLGGRRWSRSATLALSVLVVLASLAATYFVIRTGDLGARAVWTGI